MQAITMQIKKRYDRRHCEHYHITARMTPSHACLLHLPTTRYLAHCYWEGLSLGTDQVQTGSFSSSGLVQNTDDCTLSPFLQSNQPHKQHTHNCLYKGRKCFSVPGIAKTTDLKSHMSIPNGRLVLSEELTHYYQHK